jgi:hypothetical protein
MRNSIAILNVVFIGAVCAGYATTLSAQAPDSPARTKRVGVVSVIGQTYTRQYIAVTAFGNEHEEMDSSSWGTAGRW